MDLAVTVGKRLALSSTSTCATYTPHRLHGHGVDGHGVDAARGAYSPIVSSDALPPAAVVLMVSVRSFAKRSR